MDDIRLIIEVVGLLLSGGGIGTFFTLKYAKQQAKGEARSAENEATKSVQDVYQEMIEDVKRDRQEQKDYIGELKEERKHLRQERNEFRKENEELHKRINEMDEKFVSLEYEVSRKLEVINPFLCNRSDCLQRLRTSVNDLTTVKKSIKNKQ